MDFDFKKIDDLFPLNEYRPGQNIAIEKIMQAFQGGKKFVFLEAPTGAGKSAIAFTVAQFAESVYYLTTQKFLQDQLTADFGENGKSVGLLEPMIDLKGRNAYPCNYYERMLDDPNVHLCEKDKNWNLDHKMKNPSCDVGECKRTNKSSLPYCIKDDEIFCPYFKRVEYALKSRVCLMNFQSFLFQSSVVNRFQPRELLLVDECHNCEDALMKFVEITISDKRLPGVKFPEFDTPHEYVQLFIDNHILDKIQTQIDIADAMMQPRDAEEWSHMKLKIEMLMESDIDNWICQWDEKEGSHRTVSLRPIFVREFVQKYIFSKAKFVLMMSATILSKKIMCNILGVNEHDVSSFKMPSIFHPDSRPIYYRPSGSMSFKNKLKTLPKMVDDINDICSFHKNERGIIHTHSFEIANALMQNCDDDVRSRFIFQKSLEFNNNKYIMLDKHKASDNTIIIAPAMHEGLDLSDNLGRFQIICKVPYPSKGDPQIAKRLEDSPEYYDWRAATKLIQSCGRICRHEKDFGVTYVVDADFKWFVSKNKKIIPQWFIDAIKW